MNPKTMTTPTPSESIALGSAIIALCALLVAIGQLTLQRRHNRLSVRPFLDALSSRANHAPYKWTVSNAGAGPAIVRNFSMQVGNDTLTFPSLKMVEACLKSHGVSDIEFIHCFEKGGYILQNAKQEILRLSVQTATSCRAATAKISWLIEYDSIYGEHFTLQMERDKEI